MTLEAIIDWVTNKEPTLSGLVALLFILTVLFKPAVWAISWFKSAKLAKQQSLATPPKVELSFAPDTLNMSLDAYSEMQRREREAAKRELTKAHGEERQRLEEKIEELNRRLANPEEALAQQHARIVQLDEQLAKRGNEIGGDALAKADAALKAGNFDEAKEIFAQIAARTAPDVKTNADAEYALGLIAEEQVRWGDAADHYAKAARLNPSYDTLVKAGTYLWRAGRHSEAISRHEALLALSREQFGQDSEKTATAMNNLAHSYQASGLYNLAEPLFRQAMESDLVSLGEGHPDYAIGLINLAELLRTTGRYDQAEPLYQQAIEIGAKTLGEGHPEYAKWLNNLALLLQDTGRYDQAEPLFRQAMEIRHKSLGEAHPDYAQSLNNLAELLRTTGRYDQAEPLFRQAIEIGAKTLGVGHPDYATRLNNLAWLLQTTGRYDQAEPLYRQAMEFTCKSLGEGHPAYANRLNNLAVLLWQTNRQKEAVEMMARAAAAYETALGVDHPDTKQTTADLATMRAALTSKN